jgi:hypothetical protein
MPIKNRTILLPVAAAIVAGLAAFGIYEGVATITKASASAPTEKHPATITPIGKTGLNRVALTAEAANRLGIRTKPVRSRLVGGKRMTVVPYSAVVYDANGGAWVYVRIAPLVFARHRVAVTTIKGGRAALASGPRVGAQVVEVGATELFGSEAEFDEEG